MISRTDVLRVLLRAGDSQCDISVREDAAEFAVSFCDQTADVFLFHQAARFDDAGIGRNAHERFATKVHQRHDSSPRRIYFLVRGADPVHAQHVKPTGAQRFHDRVGVAADDP